MPDLRKNIRMRRKRSKKFNITLIAISSLLIIILICTTILVIKDIQTKKKLQIDTNDEHLYLLFEEINLESKNLAKIETETENSTTSVTDNKINIVSVGDILCETSIYEDAYNAETGTYDFSSVFQDVSQYTKNADITLGLLETNFIPETSLSGSGKYNAPTALADELKNIGIDILNMANNHSFDYGYNGVVSTIDYLNNIGIETVRNI